MFFFSPFLFTTVHLTALKYPIMQFPEYSRSTHHHQSIWLQQIFSQICDFFSYWLSDMGVWTHSSDDSTSSQLILTLQQTFGLWQAGSTRLQPIEELQRLDQKASKAGAEAWAGDLHWAWSVILCLRLYGQSLPYCRAGGRGCLEGNVMSSTGRQRLKWEQGWHWVPGTYGDPATSLPELRRCPASFPQVMLNLPEDGEHWKHTISTLETTYLWSQDWIFSTDAIGSLVYAHSLFKIRNFKLYFWI